MSPDSAAVERAFRNFLAARGVRLSELNLGNAFKVMLEFQRDVKFDWVDPEEDTLGLRGYELHEPYSKSAGFLGMFKTLIPGELRGYQVEVFRDLWPLGEDSTDFVNLSIVLEYTLANLEIAGFTTYRENFGSDGFESLEAFVASVFELKVFEGLALETPLSVEVALWRDGDY